VSFDGALVGREPAFADERVVVRPDDVFARGQFDRPVARVRKTLPLLEGAAQWQPFFE
jgi:hypothetical protein